MTLDRYRSKRQFAKTPEPPPGSEVVSGSQRFFIQRHHARRLHYDLRLEMDGVLKSWALPKGPTLDPADKRLAVLVEDHPLEYGTFQGTIPQGNYGAGTVSVWDLGTYELLGDASAAAQIERGDLKFRLHGQKLAGAFALVRTAKSAKDWLLIKKKDFAVIPGWDPESDIRPARPLVADASQVAGAVRSAMPDSLSPMLATLSKSLPEGPDWVYEPKWDGVRAMCFVAAGKVRLVARSGRKMDEQYPELAELPRCINADSAVIDGEIVALDANGRPSFPLLQSRITASAAEAVRKSRDCPVQLFAFDLLYLNGYDLTQASLADRKALLTSVIQPGSCIRYSEHFTNGAELLAVAREHELEGVVAKRATSSYESCRSTDWVKVKFASEQDLVICGYTIGDREPFSALVLGYWAGDQLLHAGNVGSGFDQQSLQAVFDLLRTRVVTKSSLADPPRLKEKIIWVRPEIVCRVRYMSWPRDGNMRAPVFLGIRNDVDPRDSVRGDDAPAPQPSATSFLDSKKAEQIVSFGERRLKFTNLNKVFYPREGYTKRDLINYYQAVAPLILPYLKDRPLSLKRYPNGIEGEYFFQKNAPAGLPNWIRTEPIQTDEDSEPTRFVLADDEASLLYLANLGCIDHNPWMSRVGSLDCPDFMLIDLDPYHCTFDRIVEAANLVRGMLEKLQLVGYPKTTGGDGLHLYVPLEPIYSYAQVRSFAEILARLAARNRPDLFTTPRSVAQREKGKVYFDYLQISEGKTISAPYVLRAFPGAPVATPLRWSEVRPGISPDQFNLANARARFDRLGDLFSDVLQKPQRLESALGKLEGLLSQSKS